VLIRTSRPPDERRLLDRLGMIDGSWPRDAKGFAIWLTLTLRVAFGLVAALTIALDPRPLMRGIAVWTELEIPHGGVAGLVLSPWQRWDALWYQHIVEHGYSAADATLWFFPLYPVLSRVAAALLLGQSVLAMLAVSTVACAAALWLVYRLAEHDVGPNTGALATLLVALFPTGFFLLAPYTESLFLALSLATFVALRSERPWLAAIAALGASLTRAPGALLVIPLGLYVLRRLSQRRRLDLEVLTPGLALLGPWLHNSYATFIGLQGSILSLQPLWGVRTAPPWESLAHSFDHIALTGDPNEILNVACLLFAAITLVGGRRMPLDLLLYGVATVLLLLTRDQDNLSPLLGVSRYVLVIFPCFLSLARLLSARPRLAGAVLLISGCMELAMFTYWVRWGFVA
jgi:hypothetical protein